MIEHFTTNGRLVSELLASYPTTFVALKELLNNSVQAKATEIRISIDAYPTDQVNEVPYREICVRDNGEGVHRSEIATKILDIATNVKEGGKGVGRFSCFQIGRSVVISTIGKRDGEFSRAKISFDLKKMEKVDLSVYPIELSVAESNGPSSYEVRISDLYTGEDIDRDPRKRISRELMLENVGREIFLSYSNLMLERGVRFYINEVQVRTSDYLIEDPIPLEFFYDRKDIKLPVKLSLVHYQSNRSQIRIAYATNNSGVKDQITSELLHMDIPDTNGWEIFVESELLNGDPGIYRGITLGRLDQEATDFKLATKQEIKKYFHERFADYFDFSAKLKKDDYYPYREDREISNSQLMAFGQIAYALEQEHKLLSKTVPLRKVIYPLVNMAMTTGHLAEVLGHVTNLGADSIKKFKELLDRVDLDNVIEFSSDIVERTRFLNLLFELVYSKISEKVKERKQLHKVVEKQLWIFGEQYTNAPRLFSDKGLEGNLRSLREKHFSYDPTTEDENFIEGVDEATKDITDLFFFNERIVSDEKREIMIVELKSPRCAISQKELTQVDRYLYDIEQRGEFSRDMSYTIILVSSKMTGFAKSAVGQFDRADRHLYKRSKNADISIYVYEWSDIIARNRKRLSYLGNALEVEDKSIRDLVERDYSQLNLGQLFDEDEEREFG